MGTRVTFFQVKKWQQLQILFSLEEVINSVAFCHQLKRTKENWRQQVEFEGGLKCTDTDNNNKTCNIAVIYRYSKMNFDQFLSNLTLDLQKL